MTDLHIACTLTSDAMTVRLAFIEKLAQDGLIARESIEAGLRVRLRDTEDVERRTRQLIAAESSCCSFLTFSLGRVDGELVLEISGPDDARPVIDLFFAPTAESLSGPRRVLVAVRRITAAGTSRGGRHSPWWGGGSPPG